MRSTFFFILILLVSRLSAQKNGQPLIDSLVTTLPTLPPDSGKVKVYNRIAQTYMQVDQHKGFGYADSGLQLAEKIHWKKGIANCHNTLGLMVGDTGNNTLARVHFENSLTLNKELDAKSSQISNLNNIGRSYQRQSDYARAIQYYFTALTLAEQMHNPEQVALVGTNITTGFLTQKNYAKAAEYGEMTLKNAELSKAPNHIGKALMLLGIMKKETKDTAAAKDYLARAVKVYADMNNRPAMAMVLANMAELEYPDLKKVIAKMLEVDAILTAVSPGSITYIGNIANLGNTYYELALQSRPPEKNSYLQKSEMYLLQGADLCKKTGNTEYLATITLSLADLEEAKGNYKAALDHYKAWSGTNDSLFSQERKNQIAGLEEKYQLALKDKELTLNQLTLSGQRRMELGLIAGLLLLGIIGALLYWQNLNGKKTNTTLMVLNNQLDEANKIKAKFFGILSHDLRSPIANLSHFLHLQKNHPDLLAEEDQAAHRQQISQSVTDLLENMESMLLWSKEQMDEFRPDIRDLAVSDLFDHLQKFFPQTGPIQFSFHHEPGLMVSGDRNYLQIIMQNLTSNAMKALSNTQQARIEWKARQQGNTTVLSITDNGPGLSAEQVNAFYEEGTSVNARSGFGLRLIRDLAKSIRYRITIRSQPGMGTTFTLISAVG